MSKVHVAMTRRATAEGLRAFAEKETSALVEGELARRHTEWRGVVASVKGKLAELDATCDAAMSAVPDASPDAVSQLVEKIVAAASDHADALVRRVEAQGRAESAEAQACAERLQTELRTVQQQLQAADEQLDVALAARAGAESKLEDAQIAHEKTMAALDGQVRSHQAELKANRAELAALQHRLEAAQSERVNLAAALAALRRAVQEAVSACEAGDQIPAGKPSTPEPHATGEGGATLALVPSASADSAGRVRALAPVHPDEPQDPARGNEETAHVDAEAADYVKTLLETAEAMYWEDIGLALPSLEVVERLTANLRHASHLFAASLGPGAGDQSSVFMTHVTRLLDTKSGTSFGRHLSIAAYETERHEHGGPGVTSHLLRRVGA